MDWRKKLDVFLNDFEYKNEIIGILVCGSYITGNPSSHSDLDVHIILNENVDFRERGNKIIDGLLIEYFANTPKQILQYFEEDYHKFEFMSQTQFITGKIIKDTNNVVSDLKEKAKEYQNRKFNDLDNDLHELEKYGLWNSLDDLEDMLENDKPEFYFVFYNNLDFLLRSYMKLSRLPYNMKTMLGQITSDITRQKYLLEELDDKEISEAIKNCILSKDKQVMLDNYTFIIQRVFDKSGGFDIDNFKFKSPKSI
jgi:predicted nucleotidyltransferase